jgi:hypothetical protein
LSEIESDTIDGPYRITTKDGQIIVASKIEVQDSVAVLDEPPGTTFGTAGYPVVVRIDAIESVETYKSSRWSYLWIAGIAGVVLVIYVLSVAFSGFDTGT